MNLLEKIKGTLSINDSENDSLLKTLIAIAIDYAECYQDVQENNYVENSMPANTEQGILLLIGHFYGISNGITNKKYPTNKQIWNTVNSLLNADKNIKL